VSLLMMQIMFICGLVNLTDCSVYSVVKEGTYQCEKFFKRIAVVLILGVQEIT